MNSEVLLKLSASNDIIEKNRMKLHDASVLQILECFDNKIDIHLTQNLRSVSPCPVSYSIGTMQTVISCTQS